MATISETHNAPHAGHNTLRANRIGLWIFFFSETFLFGAIISARYYLQTTHRPDELNQTFGLGITVILLLSSLSAYRAEVSAERGDHRGFMISILTTIVLGLVFVVGVGVEWYEAFAHFPPSSGFGTIFFTTTGLHGFHVLTGIVLLAFIAVKGRRAGTFGPGDYWGVEGSVKYWHFVDVAWLFIYPTLYLV